MLAEKNQYEPPRAPLGNDSEAERPLERATNAMADMDWNWWPLLSLRPAKEDLFTARNWILICCLFGPVTGLICLALFLTIDKDLAMLAGLLGTFLFFVFFRFTTVVAWNRRARRLRRAKESGSS